MTGLEATGQLRYDHYSDFGNTTNPKVSVRWQIARTALLRASWGTGFAAPTLFQLWTPVNQGLGPSGLSDPLRCPDPHAPDSSLNPDCNAQYLRRPAASNLQPAESTAVGGGVVEPLTGLRSEPTGSGWM